MSCQARRRWKTGTQFPTERPVQTEANKELQTRLEQMKAERSQQDTMWQDPPAELVVSQQSHQQKVSLPSRGDAK
jgi:hypothetical protein